jgi:predicted pyridoxine 5'-phosphate oxidase superfamily flavin-nucleotide-binding protein
LNHAFNDRIHTEEELRQLLGYPSPVVQKKAIHFIDPHCRDFISKSPIAFISTSNQNGTCDVSPRGDFPGFVSVLDENHLIIPERPGNKRLDSALNILSNPQIGMIFIIPGLEETLNAPSYGKQRAG